jgi:hypothetical protein
MLIDGWFVPIKENNSSSFRLGKEILTPSLRSVIDNKVLIHPVFI